MLSFDVVTVGSDASDASLKVTLWIVTCAPAATLFSESMKSCWF